MVAIRIIGDPILQKPGRLFPEKPSAEEKRELERQKEIATQLLISSGGAGIAANQCAAIAEPYQLIIVGVYHNNAIHAAGVEKRYPGVSFPEARLMINPKLVHSSTEGLRFYHGCLSVPGKLRGEMKTPREITVDYLTLNAEGELRPERATFSELQAVVLQHELNHILFGKTYFDCCVADLKVGDKQALVQVLLGQHGQSTQTAVKEQDFYRFIRLGEDGSSELDLEVLKEALGKTVTRETLEGLLRQCQV